MIRRRDSIPNLVEFSTVDCEEHVPEKKRVQVKPTLRDLVVKGGFWTQPWLGWPFTYSLVISFFSIYRCNTFDALIAMYGGTKDWTLVLEVGLLGFLEDIVCATYFVYVLWLFDITKEIATEQCKRLCAKNYIAAERRKQLARIGTNMATFATFMVSWILFATMMVPFVSDMLLVRLRELRFTVEIFVLAYNNLDYIDAAPISTEEFHAGYLNAFIIAIVATFFSVVRARSSWADLSSWNPTHLVVTFAAPRISEPESESTSELAKPSGQTTKHGYAKLAIEDTVEDLESSKSLEMDFDDEPEVYVRVSQGAILLGALIALPLFVLGISSSSSDLVAYSALNASLNQLFTKSLLPVPDTTARDAFDPTRLEAWAETYIHYQTEEHELFGDNSLFRRTTGFHGDLAFDVNVDRDDPPNVILISLESFRFHDSRYFVGEVDPSNLFKGTNMTITPSYDRWAKRGVSFRNMWSSTPSSRSLESVLFAQIPYDNPAKTAIAGGRNGTELAGLPQLFTAKGYETHFTTGADLGYDEWKTFLPTHGFNNVLSRYGVMALAESDLGITHDQWGEPEKRAYPWGVHDDIAFQILGDLLMNKTKEQSERLARGEPKKPVFLMHYTLSSHEPFYARPKWYDDMEKPDFSAIYEGLDRADVVKNYLEMRYFSDLELGKFMDRMEKEGVLNNTIVLMFGDHGRAPEKKNSDTRDLSVTRVPAAIVAEGRLGDAAGMVLDDVAEHYDFLNSLADITGVPEGGFLQNGVGRSLKRKIPFGKHVVFSNNPSRKMSVVRGHQRLQYDRDIDSVLLHNADTDHDMQIDLFPNLTVEEQTEWLIWRDVGRDISRYYTERWDMDCLLAVNCTGQ